MGSSEKDNDHSKTKMVYKDRVKIETEASSETKILAKAFIEFTKDGKLDEDDKQALKEIDKALHGVTLDVLQDDDALIWDKTKQKSYMVLSDKLEKTNKLNIMKKGK